MYRDPRSLLQEHGVPAGHGFKGEEDGLIPAQHLMDVPLAVWAYEVGAYQMCEKWLKDRRGEALRYEDVRQYRAILVAVAETCGL